MVAGNLSRSAYSGHRDRIRDYEPGSLVADGSVLRVSWRALAFLFERYTFPLRRLFAALAALPLVLPPLVGTVAFILLCGESGILARGADCSPPGDTALTLRGWAALLLFHTYTMYPFFYVLTAAGLRRIDAGLGGR